MRFFIASIKHTTPDCEHIIFWRADRYAYTSVVSRAGVYNREEAAPLNDGAESIAIPVATVLSAQSSICYVEDGVTVHDHDWPVVLNTKANWQRLKAARLDLSTSKETEARVRTPRRSRSKSSAEAASS